MSIRSIKNRIDSAQRDINSANRSLVDEQRKEASKSERIVQLGKSITSSTSPSSVQSKRREIDSLQRDIISIQKKKADLQKKASDKQAELFKYQLELSKEQEREQKKFFDELKRQEDNRQREQRRMLSSSLYRTMDNSAEYIPVIGTGSPAAEQVQYDAFISHASEDKAEIARPLAEKLDSIGLKVWYDEFELKVGDSLRRSIDKGLANSRFGIVILSPNFFAKEWPQRELDGLVAKEIAGGKVILPLWHKVTKEEVISYSPTLADKLALNTAVRTLDEIVEQLNSVLKP